MGSGGRQAAGVHSAFPPHAGTGGQPQLPRAARRATAEGAIVTSGIVHGIRLGHTAVHMPFDEGWFRDTIVSFHRPWFHVVFGDGGECDKTGHEIAPFILYEDANFYDPRFWSPSFDATHPGDILG